MVYISQPFSEVYLYGFDTYSSKYDNLHYFEDEPNNYKNNKKELKQRERIYEVHEGKI